MALSAERALHVVMIGVTAFFILFMVGSEWFELLGPDPAFRVLWALLLLALQTFFLASWKPSERWKRRIGWGRWSMIFLAGVAFLMAGAIGFAATPLVAPLSPAMLTWVVVVAALMLMQGLLMLRWALRHRRPVVDSWG